MYLAYRFRLYPAEHQILTLEKKFDMARNAYNTLVRWSRTEKEQKDIDRDIEENQAFTHQNDVQEENQNLPHPGHPLDHLADYFLAQANSYNLTDRSILVSALRIFAHNRKMAARSKNVLKFKKKRHARQVICFIARNQKTVINKDSLTIPLFGQIKASITRKPVGRLVTLTICRTAAGRYYISLLTKQPEPKRNVIKTLQKEKISIVGIDVGVTHFITLSDGTKFTNPRHLDRHLQSLRRCHRALSKKEEGSRNCEKARQALARKYAHINNQRHGFHQMLSAELVRKYDVIAVESIDVSHLLGQRSLARKIADAAWKQFIWILRYKAKRKGKLIIEVPRYLPSSRQCCRCHTINRALTLSDREWRCSVCKTEHDRDINAAINIMVAAAHMLLRDWPSVNPSALKPILSERR